MHESKLKPCPFCGNVGMLQVHLFPGHLSVGTYGVSCIKCHAGTSQYHDSEIDAVKAWNMRVKDE